MMEEKSGLEKAAYIILGLPVLVAAICAVGTAVATVWCTVTAFGDSEGGGWLLFIMFLLGIVVVPCLVCWIMQCIMYITGLRKYKEGNIDAARAKWRTCAMVSMVGNIIIFVFGLKTMGEDAFNAFDFVMTVIPAVLMICSCIAMVMLKKKRN